MRDKLIRLFPVPLKGDLSEWEQTTQYKVSCVFVFYKRMDLIKNALYCLAEQDVDKSLFEVILVEDRGGNREGRELKQSFEDILNISYFSPATGWGYMGYMRNFGISKSRGEVILFLDDDTIILDKNFISKLINLFEDDVSLKGVLPKGNSSFCLIKHRYCYHDPYFFSNRCVAYRRECLIDLAGFKNNFIGQEDVEFAVRFLAKGYPYIKTDIIQYYHPPFLIDNLSKSQAVGYSFAKSDYPLILKILLGINGARWFYRILFPSFKNYNMAKFALGFCLGFLKGVFFSNRKVFYT